ncbi:hypothetical protein PVAP13_5NG416700 [Panicum virgatum]|uniref:Uncharacterized protein n=1 Tax=Panicum virgatum TaxID=38727 RepID=A0A8T0S1X1_PANVG|nr:hypothetical protein PVAP13_5NG416700 [Panicum virgatum]
MAVRAAALRRPPLHRLPDRPRRLRPRRSAGLPRCPDHSFAGFGVGNDVERLYVDCGIAVAGAVDLRQSRRRCSIARPDRLGLIFGCLIQDQPRMFIFVPKRFG